MKTKLTILLLFICYLNLISAEETLPPTKEKEIETSYKTSVKDLSLMINSSTGNSVNYPCQISALFVKTDKKDPPHLKIDFKLSQPKTTLFNHLDLDPSNVFEKYKMDHTDDLKNIFGRVVLYVPSSAIIKDGISSEAAYYILLKSAVNKVDIDENFALTGRLIEGKPTTIQENLYYKIMRAKQGKCRIVALPPSSEKQLLKKVALYGPSFLSDVELYSFTSPEELWNMCQKNRGVNFTKASAIYDRVSEILKNEDADKKELLPDLKKILNLHEKHLSAKLIKTYIEENVENKTLSVEESTEHLLDSFEHYMDVITPDQNRGITWLQKTRSSTEISRLQTEINSIFTQKSIHVDTLKVKKICQTWVKSIYKYVKSNQEKSKTLKSIESEQLKINAVIKKMNDEKSNPKSSYRRLAEREWKSLEKKEKSIEKKISSTNEQIIKIQRDIQKKEAQERAVQNSTNKPPKKTSSTKKTYEQKKIERYQEDLSKLRTEQAEYKNEALNFKKVSEGLVNNPKYENARDEIQKKINALKIEMQKISKKSQDLWNIVTSERAIFIEDLKKCLKKSNVECSIFK